MDVDYCESKEGCSSVLPHLLLSPLYLLFSVRPVPNCLSNTYNFTVVFFLVLYVFCLLLTRQKKQIIGGIWEANPFLSFNKILMQKKQGNDHIQHKVTNSDWLFQFIIQLEYLKLCLIFKGCVQHLLKIKRRGFPRRNFLIFW